MKIPKAAMAMMVLNLSLIHISRLDWGGTASVGIAVKRISFTVGYDLAWGKYNKEQNDLRIRNHMVSFTSGYSF